MKKRAAKDYIVFPLDVASVKEAAQYVSLLSDWVGMFKVGLELFVQTGPEIVGMIKKSGNARIFLDLKLHDIPETVYRAMCRVAEMGVAFATVHCGESPRMLDAAVKGGGGNVGVLAVTVLTSITSEDIQASGFKEKFTTDMSNLVIKRAQMAKTAGCAGVVCSGREVKMIKEVFGTDFVAVTPGIRPEWGSGVKDDQRRIVTPSEAVSRGADFLVIGRPIRDAEDPVTAAQYIAEEIDAALTDS
ncbi:MAG: orotidine-5'-phosphate decarboxylase [Desulfobacterales bacterium]|jgi:orotidine-5'-phosphate decarboxylase|nr:orotidine-5'-phosphate decarboxylase [Desulfobacterales bacterium]